MQYTMFHPQFFLGFVCGASTIVAIWSWCSDRPKPPRKGERFHMTSRISDAWRYYSVPVLPHSWRTHSPIVEQVNSSNDKETVYRVPVDHTMTFIFRGDV